jgi:hypothetical protein
MARIDSFLKKWASVPSQFERPTDALIDRGWAGGAAEDPPEAKWENWWHNRVDEALSEIESKGAMQWFDDVPYAVGATSRDEGQNWIAALPSTGIKPGSVDDAGHWQQLSLLAATQAEAEAGTENTKRMTPLRVRQAIVSGAVAREGGATGAAILPSGTTAQRPASPANGFIRYNTDISDFESYIGGAWVPRTAFTRAVNEATPVTLASAATVDIGAASANTVNISGTTTITSLGTVAAGATRRLVFLGALTLTHNAASLILPSGTITTAAGDVAQFVSLGSGNWRCVSYERLSGRALTEPQVDERRLCTAWVNFNGTGTVTIRDSYNVSSITDDGIGVYTVNFATGMASTSYAPVAFARSDLSNYEKMVCSSRADHGKSTSAFTLFCAGSNNATQVKDSPEVNVIVFGGKS